LVGEPTMTRSAAPVLFLFAYLVVPLKAQQSTVPAGPIYQLKPTPQTVVLGYYDPKTPPVLRIKSGDTVEIQTLIASSPERFDSAGLDSAQSNPQFGDFTRRSREQVPVINVLPGRALSEAP